MSLPETWQHCTVERPGRRGGVGIMMIDKILYELSGLFSSLNTDRAIDIYKLREEIDRLHATLNEYRESEIVLRARIEELEEMLNGKD